MKTKVKLMKWLIEIKLIKENRVSIDEFPKYLRTGVLFCDIINTLESRNKCIKGIIKDKLNMTQILNNFKKLRDYLANFPKMNPRYLWAEELMIVGKEDVLWGYLDDIWHLKHNKISPFDPSNPDY